MVHPGDDRSADAAQGTTPLRSAKCPHCGGEIHISTVARAVAGSSVVFAIWPGKNGVLNLRNFGRIVEQFGKFTEALSRDAGLNEKAFLSGLKFKRNGGVEIGVKLATFEKKSLADGPKGQDETPDKATV